MTDLWYYQRVGCCILGSAIGILETNGLPVPDRTEVVYSGKLGDPLCCDALLVTPGLSRQNQTTTSSARNTQAQQRAKKACGPLDKIIEWDVRIFRSSCAHEPECAPNTDPFDCFEQLGCPDQPWPEPPTDNPCDPKTRAWQQSLMLADRMAFEAQLAAEIDCCLSDNSLFDCDVPCAFECSEPTMWTSTTRQTGGGCGGSILKLQTHTIGK